MAITLGKDATISVGGTVASVRNVQFRASSRTIEIEEYGTREAAVYSTGWNASVSFEINDDADMDLDLLLDGTLVAVSGGIAGWSFNAIVTDVAEVATLDGAVTWQVECALTKSGLRA